MLDFCPIPYPKGTDPLIIKMEGREGGKEAERDGR